MKKSNVFLSKSQIRRVIQYFTIFFITISVGSILFFYKYNFYNKIDSNNNADIMSNLFSPLKLKPITFEINSKDSLTSEFRKIVSSSFNEYFQYCSNFDEYRPNENECISQFGFSATLFDSLDVLFILGLTNEFQKVKNFIKNIKFQWINRREFWSRCIGSLLSTYIITQDTFFLSKATEFSKELLKSSQTAPFVNFENKKIRNNEWIKGTSLTDIISGLPELFSLSKLTNDESFSISYLTILNNIPTFSNNSVFNFYDLELKQPIVELSSIDGNVIDFYHQQSIAFSIKPIKSLKKNLENVLNQIELNKDELCFYSRYSSLYDTLSIIEKNGIKIDNKFSKNSFLDFVENPKSFFESNCSSIFFIPFRFDASFLRALLRDFDDCENKVLNFINFSLNECKLKNGFSGLLKINSNEIVHTNIQHSNFFGQWMSIASYLLTNQKKIVKDAVFNERGHLLYSPLIFPNDEDD